MFNIELRKQAVAKFEEAVDEYNLEFEKCKNNINELIEYRNLAIDTIDKSLTCINKFKNTPEEIEKEIGAIRYSFGEMDPKCFEKKLFSIKNKLSLSVGLSSVMFLVGLAALSYGDNRDDLRSDEENKDDSEITNNVSLNNSFAFGAMIVGLFKTLHGIIVFGKENKEIADEANAITKEIYCELSKIRAFNKRLKLAQLQCTEIHNGLLDYLDYIENFIEEDGDVLSDDELIIIATLVNNLRSLANVLAVAIDSDITVLIANKPAEYAALNHNKRTDILNSYNRDQDIFSQALAAWGSYLDLLRKQELYRAIKELDFRKEGALLELNKLKQFVADFDHILGNMKTKHGEVAEHCQVNISNARSIINGMSPSHSFDGVGRTAPEDYLFGGVPVQSKFYNGAKGTLRAVIKHFEKYPFFVKEGGRYDIPKNQYEEMIHVLNLYKNSPSAISSQQLRLLNAIQKFENETGLSVENNLFPSVVSFRDVQLGNVQNTIKREENGIETIDEQNRSDAIAKSKPTFEECIKVTSVGAGIEGGLAFALTIIRKRKEGKKIYEFSIEDWKEIGIDTSKGIVKGGIRGSSLYAITNYTAIPGNIAAAYVSAALAMCNIVDEYRKNNITDEEMIVEAECVCLDAALSAISAFAGQMIIPIPVLGTLIGNVCASFMLDIAKEINADREYKQIQNYKSELEYYKKEMSLSNEACNKAIELELQRFDSLKELAFSQEANVAFEGSAQLAGLLDVPENKIIKNLDEARRYIDE